MPLSLSLFSVRHPGADPDPGTFRVPSKIQGEEGRKTFISTFIFAALEVSNSGLQYEGVECGWGLIKSNFFA